MKNNISIEDLENLEDEWKINGRIPEDGEPELLYKPEDIVKSCPKLESGIRFGEEGIRACCMGAILSPLYWSSKQAAKEVITKEKLIIKRKWLFKCLNEKQYKNISCKRCHLVEEKKFKDVCFDKIGHLNLAHYSMCNLRCNFCTFTQNNEFKPEQYEVLPLLREFKKEDVEWNSYVDLNGGEPTLLKNLKEYIDYFKDMGIRILLYTNAVKYNSAIYNGILDGTITWLIISLDSGTPDSFFKIKGRNYFDEVIENITRYSEAGSKGLGNVAVKYIFAKDNCSDSDVTGFTYLMLAIRPQEVWLTFDFFPLIEKYEDQKEIGVYDYSTHIISYSQMYLKLKKHGLEAVHFTKNHTALVSDYGKEFLKNVEKQIKKLESEYSINDSKLKLQDFRRSFNQEKISFPPYLKLNPLEIENNSGTFEEFSLKNKKIFIAPACLLAEELISKNGIKEAKLLGFLDRDPVLHNKSLRGYKIFPYKKLETCNLDYVIVASPSHYQKEIFLTINKYKMKSVKILLLKT